MCTAAVLIMSEPLKLFCLTNQIMASSTKLHMRNKGLSSVESVQISNTIRSVDLSGNTISKLDGLGPANSVDHLDLSRWHSLRP